MKKSIMIAALLVAASLVSAAQTSHTSPRVVAPKAQLAAPQVPAPPQVAQVLPQYRFENFTTANGLPDNHVYSVLVDGDRIWAGTEDGLAVYENHEWKT